MLAQSREKGAGVQWDCDKLYLGAGRLGDILWESDNHMVGILAIFETGVCSFEIDEKTEIRATGGFAVVKEQFFFLELWRLGR
jgi:hypothetical protein